MVNTAVCARKCLFPTLPASWGSTFPVNWKADIAEESGDPCFEPLPRRVPKSGSLTPQEKLCFGTLGSSYFPRTRGDSRLKLQHSQP